MAFATEIVKRDRKPIFIITIEGVGYLDSTTAKIKKWCTNIPSYVSTNAEKLNVYRPMLSSLSSFGEELDLERFTSSVDGLSFSLSRRGNEFDSFILGHKKHVTRLSAAVANATTTSISFYSTSWRDVGSAIYIGQECVVYDGTNYIRGAYGTIPSAHNIDDPVFEGLSYLKNRIVTLYLVYNHDGITSSDETQVWQGFVDNVSLSHNKTEFNFSCSGYSSSIKNRSIFSGYTSFNVEFITIGKKNFTNTGDDTGNDIFLEVGEKESIFFVDSAPASLSFGTSRFFKTYKGEVIQISGTSITGSNKWQSGRVLERGLFGTQTHDDYIDDKGDNVKAVEVFMTDPSYATQFRIQARNAETSSVSTGTWTMSTHPIDILLNFLTSSPNSSAVLADGTTFTAGSNYTSGKGNYSSLPLGMGIGVLASKIDFDSFFYVKNLVIPDIRMDGFIFSSDSRENFVDWASREVLQPLGLYMTTNKSGQIQITKVEHYNRVSTYTTIDRDDTLSVTQEISSEDPITEIVFEMKTPEIFSDKTIKEIYKRNDILSMYPLKESEGFRQNKKYFKLSGVRSDNKSNLFFEDIAIFHFQMSNQALPIITIDTDISLINTFSLGDYFNFTDNEIINPSTGTAGVTAYVCQIISKRIVFPNKIQWTAIMHHTGYRLAGVSPAGIIASVTAWDFVSNYVIVLEANNFSNSELSGSNFAGYARDAAGFASGYLLELFDANGVKRSTQSGVIGSVSTNTITFTTHFGAAITPAAGDVIMFRQYASDDIAAMHNFSYRSTTGLALGVTSDDPYQYH